MTGFIHWFAMSGYAIYIWPAYGLVFFVLMMNLFFIKRQGLRARNVLRQWFNQS